MTKLSIFAVLLFAAGCATLDRGAGPGAVAHDAFFELDEPSESAIAELIAACNSLRPIPGVVDLVAGPRAVDYDRAPNQLDFHVGLHVVFEDRAAYAGYLPHPIHQRLIEVWMPKFASVRVFDYDVSD